MVDNSHLVSGPLSDCGTRFRPLSLSTDPNHCICKKKKKKIVTWIQVLGENFGAENYAGRLVKSLFHAVLSDANP
jgi:hypothetical protein